MKKALFIGGTGTISSAITRRVASFPDWELYLLNRGTRQDTVPEGVIQIHADINDEKAVEKCLEGMSFDCVCEFIGFTADQVERDWRLFKDRTRQYMYISSASVYQKPPVNHVITEGTPMRNPYSLYARNKIACEEFLMAKFREEGFPVTIIRPTLTYDERRIPLEIKPKTGTWPVARRMLAGKPVLIHGDGESLWTMTHNSDFAVGFTGLMNNPHAIGNAFQITSGETLTWNQIYQAVADALGVELKAYHVASDFLQAVQMDGYDLANDLHGDKARSVIFDNSKLKRAVPEFNPTVRFNEGIKRTVDYILSHPECQTEDPAFDAWCDRVIEALENAKKSINTH